MRPRHPNGFAGFAENTYWEISANLSGFLDKKVAEDLPFFAKGLAFLFFHGAHSVFGWDSAVVGGKNSPLICAYGV